MRAAPVLRSMGGSMVVLLGLAACGGERVRLGDGPSLTATAPPPLTTTGGPGASTEEASSHGHTSAVTGGSVADASSDAGSLPAGCQRDRVSGDEVLWVGDSWLTIPGTQRTQVESLARAAGALGTDESYVSAAAPASTLAAIAEQYAERQSGDPKVRVLIMDGGTWDTILTNAAQASIRNVTSTFQQFLARVSDDGSVEHIIYMLPPELPTIPGVAELRPGLTAACQASLVPCHFLDLQPLWEGHPEYTAPDGIQASESGATVIAEAIWTIMVDHCIAQ